MIRLDLIRQAVSSAPGTGSISLGSAQTGYIGIQDHPDTIDGMTVEYVIKDGDNKEFGIGTYSSTGDVLARTWIQGKIDSGVYSKNPGTGLTLTANAIVSCAPVATNLNFMGCLLKRTSNQSITSGIASSVAFTNEVYDTDNFHDTTTNNSRITIPVNSGITVVKLNANIRFSTNSSGYRSAYIQKNGSAILDGTAIIRSDPTATNDYMANLSSPCISVVNSDYFELIVDQNSGSALDLVGTSGHTWLSLEVIQ